MATDAPPSYDSIISKVDNNIKQDPTVEGLKRAFDSLDDEEKTILAAREHEPIELNPEQLKQFHQGFSEGFSQVQEHLEWKAANCAEQCKKVATDFLNITDKLSSISSLDGSEESQKLVSDFKSLEKEAEDLEKEAQGIHDSFSNFLADIYEYTARFDSWAQKKEGSLNDKITQLNKDIQDLKKEISKITTAMIAIGAVAGFALPALAVGAAVAGPFAPLVIGIAIFAAVGTVASVTALAFKKSSLDHEIEAKEDEKKKAQEQLGKIQKARTELKDLGKSLDDDVNHIVGVINTAWKYCQADAVEIRRWLEQGQKDADLPPYMAIQLGKADGIYSVVGRYLRKYADALANTSGSS
ncbi:general substrate transporter-like protein [Thermothelomyces thermophilus ATCC 42464]|uniref:General substrate transporter-like protein n=1 Tax=Thermothelomyces thermophilus (strain ATCC 42464 / BCRC 31852 / DSM 1799) TaxID=573729 RepID=G2QDI0_THET4|nr:general substrate transporter-like protein [Thermothelomyces thermophilus ATCC 42464]AEO57492.1 general substrate transporter-like protein [Thermothelomyces thermophilus ATCC 42464]